MIIPFGEWLPDQTAFGNEGATVAANVVPVAKGYRSLPAPAVYADSTLPHRPNGATAVFDNGGNAFMFAACMTSFHRLDPATLTWADASKLGGYTGSSTTRTQFTEYGNWVIATNYTDNPQYFDISSSTAFADLTTEFKAKYVATVNDFVVFANLNDNIDGVVPHRIRWSGLGMPNYFVNGDPEAMSDFQDIPDAGKITGLVGGTNHFIVFLEKSVKRFNFSPSGVIFERADIANNVGCMEGGSIARVGDAAFFLAEDGFYMTDGGSISGIGSEKVNRWFFDNADMTRLSHMTTTVDPYNQLVLWAFPTPNAPEGECDRLLVYNYALSRWSTVELPTTVSVMTRFTTLGQTLESLDIYGSIEAVPASLDSRIFAGGKNMLAALGPAGRVLTFTGAALPATLETGETQLAAPARAFVQVVKPLVDGAEASSQVLYRNRQSEAAYQATAEVLQNEHGWCPTRIDAKYHRFRIKTTGDFNTAIGVDIDFVQRGLK